MKEGTIALRVKYLMGKYRINTDNVLISGSNLIGPDMFDNDEYSLSAPFQRCLRAKGGKDTFQNSCLPGSFNDLSLVDEPGDKQKKWLVFSGATAGFFLNPASEENGDDDSVNVSIGGGD